MKTNQNRRKMVNNFTVFILLFYYLYTYSYKMKANQIALMYT